MSFKLGLSTVEEEVQLKNESMLNLSDKDEKLFCNFNKQLYTDTEFEELNLVLDFARNVKSVEKNHPSSSMYFIHSLRVANLVSKNLAEKDLELVKTALIHNYFEITGKPKEVLKQKGFSDFTVDGIEVVTVDRSRQFDDDYLDEYFKRVLDFSPRIAFMRCMDKLDNLLAMQLISGERRERFISTTEKHVLPLLRMLNNDLGGFMSDTIDFMKRCGSKKNLVLKYNDLLRMNS